MDIAMMIWVLKGIDGRVAIMDSGSVSNLRAQDRMRSLASDPRLVIPGTTLPSSIAFRTSANASSG
jgi:hypothetical protein